MFLTNPTLKELIILDLVALKEMLNRQIIVFVDMLREEGVTSKSKAQKNFLHNIQEAINFKSAETSSRSDEIFTPFLDPGALQAKLDNTN